MKLKNYFLFTILAFLGLIFRASAQIGNTFAGTNSGANNTGNYNSGFGFNSLINNTAFSNSAFGNGTLISPTGGFNCAFGNNSLQLNGSGKMNCALGTRTLENNLTGSANVAIGHRSLGDSNIFGSNNTAIGYATLVKTAGSGNIAVGYNTPRNLLTGNYNLFVGTETGVNLINGNYNVFLGKVSVSNNPSTSIVAGNNTNQTIILADGLGNQRLFVSKNGSMGIGLGNNVIPVNKLDIGGGVVIGKNYTPKLIPFQIQGAVAPNNGLIVEGKVGIGNISPNNKMEITHGTIGNSGLRFTNLTNNFNPTSTATSDKFLSVNALGDVVLLKIPVTPTTNLLASNGNLLNSAVNGISSGTTIVNSISNSINTNSQLVTTVNGVASTPVNLPNFNFTEVDGSISNELQTLSQVGNTVTLSNNGGSFTLPTFTDTDAQSLTLTGNNLSISNGNTVVLPTFTEVDGSISNELQTLSQVGNTITLSNNGGSFTLPTFTEVDGSISNELQTLSQVGNIVTLSNNGGSFTLPTFTDTDAQLLTLTGNNLSISNGNTVVLPTFTEVDGSISNELQTLSQVGNTVTLSNNGGSFTLPTFTDTDAQLLTLTGNNLSISNGNSVVIPTTHVTAGNNITVTGNGSTASPFQVSSIDTSLYANNGSINQATTTNNNRIVDMNNRNIWFNTTSSTSNGKVYIGATSVYPNTTGDYKLFVEGGILTEKVKVALRSTANWADYVFADTYKLMSLSEVEKFITANKHLPGIDSASELFKNGIDVADIQSKQMAKIEELTLYAIEQDKKLAEQDKAIEKSAKEIEELKILVAGLIKKNN